MADFCRNKRVTNFFDDDARARLIGCDHRKLSSDSTKSFYSSNDDSLSLFDLVHGFLEQDCNDVDDSVANELDSDRVDSVEDCTDSVEDSLRLKSLNAFAFTNNVDTYKNTLLAHVSEAMEKIAFLREQNFSIFRKSVAALLKEKGHDATVCVTAWDSSSAGCITAGSHEFIDVAQSGSSTWRYFLDLDFRSQFEIAKPTRQFSEVLSSIPVVFVGGASELKRTVSVACDAARRCFTSRGLMVPPWRKNRFMQNKWFAPCRTANPIQGKPVRVTIVNGVSCRLVGFGDGVMEARRGGGVVVRTK